MPTNEPLPTRTFSTAEAADRYAGENKLSFDNQGDWCEECRAYHVEIAHLDAVNIMRSNEATQRELGDG